LVAIAALGILAPALASDASAPPPTPSPEDIRVLTVEHDQRLLPGATRHRRAVTLSASFDAPIMELLVEEGQLVRKGQIIARLDNRVASASHKLAEQEAAHTAAIDRARASFERAERTLKRATDAHARKGVSDEELDDARTGVAIAQAELAQARESHNAAIARAEQAAARLEEHNIRAPFDGTVMRLRAEVGAVLRTGDPIADLADPRAMTADLYLPAATALAIEQGARYAIAIDEPVSRVLWARARYVEPRVDPTSNTMRTVFDFETPHATIPAGLIVYPADRPPTADELTYMQRNPVNHPRVADATTPG
jgi:RND family efflux transporter MFP subunit